MFTSFYSAISGLNANTTSLNVIANNLANTNTIGFKSDIISFQDLLNATTLGLSLAGNPIQIGLGTKVSSVSGNFNQGSLKNSTQPTDMAIIGTGFFVVNAGEKTLYTRAGNFTINREGYLTTQQGYTVQGWNAINGVVNTDTPTADLQIGLGQTRPPAATDSVQVNLNLNANTTVGGTFATSNKVYDSLGVSHTVTYTFTKTATGWNYAITCPDGTVTGGTGSLTFDSSGRLTAPATNPTIGITGLTSGAADISYAWHIYDATTPTTPVISQYASASAVISQVITGYPSGSLSTFAVDTNGLIQGIYDNGQVSVLGRVALATFNSPQGLIKNGQNTYAESLASGSPAVGVPGSGGRGSLSGNTLEMSNVDLANEFASLIITQRGYQACSKVVTTTDEISQEAINLKR